MSWIDILWPMMAAASLTLGGIYLLIWLRERDQAQQLMLSLAAASVSSCAILELLMLHASTTEQYAWLLRWAHVSVAVLIFSLVGFVLRHFRGSRPWLGITVCALRAAALFANFLSGENLNFKAITALDQVPVWGAGFVAIPVGSPNPWMLLGQLSNLLMVVFLVDTILSTWRGTSVDERRRVTLVCGSMALFVLLASVWTLCVVMGWVKGPLTINVAFLLVIITMSYELGGNVIRAARLGRQLRQSESSLRESEQRMQLAATAGGLGLWSWDLESKESWFTESGNTLLGLRTGEPIERDTLLAQIHPDDRAEVVKARDEAIRGSGEYACEFRLPQPAGYMRWVAAKGRVEYSPSGEPLLLRGVIQDVTQRKEADARFRLVIEEAPMPMLMIDAGEHITLANAKAERVFGYSNEELLGKRIQHILPDPSLAAQSGRRRHFAAPPSLSAIGVGRELFGVRKDGTSLAVEVALTPIRFGDEAFMLAAVTDISERVRLQQETALQREELAHLSRVTLLGEMSGSLAHELNQPLTAVLSNAQAALRFLDHNPPNLDEIRDCLVHVVENDKRASDVIRRLRAMLRKEQGSFQQLSINEVILDVLRLINSDLLNRNVLTTLDLDPGLPELPGDRVQLQQVLLNLVINACDAMEEITVGRTIHIQTQRGSGPAVQVSISDIGRGVPPADLERIFMPFITSKMEGIGLGLPICRTLIEAHRGTLWATNNASVGATLHFMLPTE